ncbi:hypothetical protein [Propionivibrio sp.]|uniref:hypothetical protein n=1 Tax=Propionivibrio sp. TaxID=2212460 RepID=UPI003BF41B67
MPSTAPSVIVIGEHLDSIILIADDESSEMVYSRYAHVPKTDKMKVLNDLGTLLDWRHEDNSKKPDYSKHVSIGTYIYITATKTFEAAANMDNPNLVIGLTIFRANNWTPSRPIYISRPIGIFSVTEEDVASGGINDLLREMFKRSSHFFRIEDYHPTSLVQTYLGGVKFTINNLYN